IARAGEFGTDPSPHLRVMLQALHSEQMNYVVPYHFMKLICEEWDSDPILEAMRWGVEWSVIPALNPYAIDNNQRPNANNVDINRNYPIGWTFNNTTPGYGSGPNPLSELETQYSYALMQSFKPHIFIDCHSYGLRPSPDESYFLWYGSGGAAQRAVSTGVVNRLARKWRDENGWVPAANALGYVTGAAGIIGGISEGTAEALGAYAMTYETAWLLQSEPGSARGSPLAVRYAVEGLGNYLISLLRKIAT
ncbi:MAG: M14 family metallopeptidase, partial [Sphingobium sp.]